MNANTQKLQALGQSLWIDNITRDMLDNWLHPRDEETARQGD